MSTLRSFYRDTKALSPVVATILLVAIAVIASVLTYLWATGFIGAIQTRPNQATETIHVQAGTVATGATPAFSLYVQDAGTAGVTYQEIFLLNTAGTVLGSHAVVAADVTASSGTCTALTTSCDAGSIALISATVTGTTVKGQQYILQITTKVGTSAEITVTAP